MSIIINRAPMTIGLDEMGNLAVTLNGKPLDMPYGYNIKALQDVKGTGTAPLVAAAQAKGATHLMGMRVALLPGEAEAIAQAQVKHPALIAKAATFAAECDRLAAAERAENQSNAWQHDPRMGFAEGPETPDRADNTPMHKPDF